MKEAATRQAGVSEVRSSNVYQLIRVVSSALESAIRSSVQLMLGRMFLESIKPLLISRRAWTCRRGKSDGREMDGKMDFCLRIGAQCYQGRPRSKQMKS